jgi:nitrate/nitrite transporter NarK
MGEDPPPPPSPPQPCVLLPGKGRLLGGEEDVVAQQGNALANNEGDGGSLAPNESDSACINASSEASSSSLRPPHGSDAGAVVLSSSPLSPPPQAFMLPSDNSRISSSSNNNADLLLLRRCQRDARLLMARRYRVTAAAAPLATAASEEDLQEQREPDGAECCYDDDDDGAEAKEASRHNHPILYIATEHPPSCAFRTDESALKSRPELLEEEQYHYVVTAASSSGIDEHIRQQEYGGGGDGSILSSLKDSYMDEARGLDEPSLATAASGPWSLHSKAAHQRRPWRGGGCSSANNIDEGLEMGECDPSASVVDHKAACDQSDVEMNDNIRGGGSKDSQLPHGDEEDEDEDDGCTLSGAPDSDYPAYRVRVNPEQMDRAVDIPLYSAARPHMRAFHISWIAFFVSFFVWFSISPLLGEIATTLRLTHEQIWTSSCLAVASSAITRIVVGPLNDMFGARYIMAATLVAAAIPTMLAGVFVNTPASLYLVRFFIGMAGSAFVTCQYWTSCMFTVEIAGTANALVRVFRVENAGAPRRFPWLSPLFCHSSNDRLPGGAILAGESVRNLDSFEWHVGTSVFTRPSHTRRLFLTSCAAQIVVGSLLFPLFKLMYGGSGYSYHGEGEANSFETSGGYYTTPDESVPSTNSNTNETNINGARSSADAQEARASELAWRTVLVIPAVMALVMAWVVVRYSDDTPKGCVRTRRHREQLSSPSPQQPQPRPSWSENLWRGMRSRNAWVLFVQYACCFGCELALFNAAALYFKDAFGQSTESAAAIASIFGWTNLFARGIGGFCSDMANAKCGMRGRLWVQACFLVTQGVLIMAFSEAHTLAGSIVTMVLFGLFLQASEGSTFAIVPYVVPEQMGSVAGLVGAGGNVGGVCFTLLFRSFDYQTSFLYMGAAVSVSALFTLLVSLPGHRGLFHGHDSPIVYEHRRMAKLPQAVAFVRPENARNPPSEPGPAPAAESTPEGAGGTGAGTDDGDHDDHESLASSSTSGPANP